MTELDKEFKGYYKTLIKTFGHVECKGIIALAYALALYNPLKTFRELNIECAEAMGSTPTAVERALRRYLRLIETDINIEDLSVMLDYEFKPNESHIKVATFVPLLYLALQPDTKA